MRGKFYNFKAAIVNKITRPDLFLIQRKWISAHRGNSCDVFAQIRKGSETSLYVERCIPRIYLQYNADSQEVHM